jgi:hypothetical protein
MEKALTQPSGGRPAGMTPQDVDEMLDELAAVVDEAIADLRAAERAEAEMADRPVRLLRVGDRLYPRRTYVRLQWELACQVLSTREQDARELAAWWADLATVAAVAALRGEPLHPVRAAAGDPATSMDDEDMRHLPTVSDFDRNLARLATLYPTSHHYDLSHAARIGVYLDPTDDGDLVVVDDPTPVGRRRRLWGDDWIDHQVPALPRPDELADQLAQRGVPANLVAEVLRSAHAVHNALAASRYVHDLEQHATDEKSWDAHAEARDSLSGQIDQLTDLLADYARRLTATLPAIRGGSGHAQGELQP